MDYWEYLAHGQKGAERDDHRYYARELVGNRGGKNVYRYFYSAEEYAAYKNGRSGEKKSIGAQKAEMDRRRARREGITAQKKDMDTARSRAEHQQSVAGQKKVLDRARRKASIASTKAKLDERRAHRDSVASQKKAMDVVREREQCSQPEKEP